MNNNNNNNNNNNILEEAVSRINAFIFFYPLLPEKWLDSACTVRVQNFNHKPRQSQVKLFSYNSRFVKNACCDGLVSISLKISCIFTMTFSAIMEFYFISIFWKCKSRIFWKETSFKKNVSRYQNKMAKTTTTVIIIIIYCC